MLRDADTSGAARGFPSIQAEQFRAHLLAWYNAHARDLPWRKNRDPYRVWLSEIMLQQTRVAAVIAHYQAFLRRFPTVEKLARAREASVLAAWSGLGYYRRARMMHAAAKLIVQKHGGNFPSTAERWRDLPGIGRYTSAAIASISFDASVAVVDGNVERVLQRWLGLQLGGEEVWTSATQLLDRTRPGDFNQAMMELGATVCTPRAPMCLMCPVRESCATQGELRAATHPAPQKKQEVHYALHIRGVNSHSEVFLVQRPKQASLMAGMWELPETVPLGNDKPHFTVRHSITITNYTVHVWQRSMQHGVVGRWIPTHQMKRIALTGLTRKIMRKAGLLHPNP